MTATDWLPLRLAEWTRGRRRAPERRWKGSAAGEGDRGLLRAWRENEVAVGILRQPLAAEDRARLERPRQAQDEAADAAVAPLWGSEKGDAPVAEHSACARIAEGTVPIRD